MALHHRSPSFAIAVVLAATLLVPASDSLTPPKAAALLASCLPEETYAGPVSDPAEPILVKYLSRRFFFAAAASERMGAAGFPAARGVGLDPLPLLAGISVEARLYPPPPSGMGGQGPLQII